ncbi:response regulator [Planctomycetota bacterium]
MVDNLPCKNNGTTRILIVDDHPIVFEGLCRIIDREPDLEICGNAKSAPEAIAAIAKYKPDLVTVDISLHESDGLELIKDLKTTCPDLHILVISMHEESIYAERVFRLGAKGYIMKDEVAENLIKAIKIVLNQEKYMSDKLKTHLAHKAIRQNKENVDDPIRCLSDRELQVFHYLGNGYSNIQMAEILKLSVKTIEKYKDQIKKKMSIKDNSELLKYCIRWLRSEK